MTVAAIAYKHLKQNSPGTIAKWIAILKTHPEFDTRWKKRYDSLPANDREIFLFMAAARWPDDIRSEPSYTHPFWHYIDNPITFTSSPTGNPNPENILVALESNLQELKSATTTPANKAIALCWIFHLVGDLHQPLHNVSLFSADFAPPLGDKGGNNFLIKEPALELHRYWDDVFLSDDKANYKPHWFTAVNTAATVAMKSKPVVAFNGNTSFDANAFKTISLDGVTIAKSSVYKHAGHLLKPGLHNGTPPVPLPAGYSTESAKIATHQIALAGMRLAVILKNL